MPGRFSCLPAVWEHLDSREMHQNTQEIPGIQEFLCTFLPGESIAMHAFAITFTCHDQAKAPAFGDLRTSEGWEVWGRFWRRERWNPSGKTQGSQTQQIPAAEPVWECEVKQISAWVFSLQLFCRLAPLWDLFPGMDLGDRDGWL